MAGALMARPLLGMRERVCDCCGKVYYYQRSCKVGYCGDTCNAWVAYRRKHPGASQYRATKGRQSPPKYLNGR